LRDLFNSNNVLNKSWFFHSNGLLNLGAVFDDRQRLLGQRLPPKGLLLITG
tara:strand:- start:515 stop:667 length:153 start_codon:yes stop_codon:yes gene_type:complete